MPRHYPISVVSEIPGINRGQVTEYYQLPANLAQSERTYLIQLPITSVADSLVIFGCAHPNGCTPLVLLPKKYFSVEFVVVPSGVFAIKTEFGKITGEMPAGLHLLLPGHRVQYIISKQHSPFDYPVKACPTLDNVMVKIDTLVVFHVVDAQKFVINLGAIKLNDLLAAFLEESIRSLARTRTYNDVYDLRGKSMASMTRSLNDKLVEAYGIEVESLTIQNVSIPTELQQSMERTTCFNALDQTRERSHNFDMILAEHAATCQMLQLDKKNERAAASETAVQDRLLISKEASEIEAVTQKRLAEINSETDAKVQEILFTGESQEASFRAQAEQQLIEMRAQASKEAALVNADQQAYVKVKSAEAQLNVASNRADALMKIAAAEAQASKALAPKRQYVLQQERLKIIDNLCKNPHVVISGSSDYNAMAQIGSNIKGLGKLGAISAQ